MVIEPVDPRRCQAEWTQYNAFVMGGNVYQRRRCENPAAWVVTETEPDERGERGAMSLCDECKQRCIEEMGDRPMEFVEIVGGQVYA